MFGGESVGARLRGFAVAASRSEAHTSYFLNRGPSTQKPKRSQKPGFPYHLPTYTCTHGAGACQESSGFPSSFRPGSSQQIHVLQIYFMFRALT